MSSAAPVHPLLSALAEIRGGGTFQVSGDEPFAFPGIVLPDGEELAFPLAASQAKAVIRASEPAPYGMGTETKLDKSVRRSWQLDASALAWTNPDWETVVERIAAAAAKALGVPGPVVADPYKLLLYEPGGFFLPHRDTEKIPGMFGSLIVSLPASHEGGELVIRHDGRTETVAFGTVPRGRMRWAAFYADCEHEVRPVTRGYRLCLTYNLAAKAGKKGKKIAAPVSTGSLETLRPGVRDLRESRKDDLTAILLEHRYTEDGFSVAALKGDDRAPSMARDMTWPTAKGSGSDGGSGAGSGGGLFPRMHHAACSDAPIEISTLADPEDPELLGVDTQTLDHDLYGAVRGVVWDL